MTMPVPRRALPFCSLAALILTASSCSHSDAFTPADPATDQPLSSAPPVRLTYSPLADLTPSWLPDGSAFIYAFGDAVSRLQNDQCLGIMAPSGGTRRAICNLGPFAADSTDTFASPAVSAGGRLAYVRGSKPAAAQDEHSLALVYGPLADPASFAIARTLPFQGDGAFYTTVEDPSWLGEGRLLLLGMTDTSIQCADPPVCQIALLIRSGRDILIADLVAGGAVMTPLPGTSWASSVTRGGSDDEMYYTVAASSQVLRGSLGAAAPTVAHDFLGSGIARDVTVAGTRMAAVVGGLVKVYDDGSGNPIQQDVAGRLFLVNLGTGDEQELVAPLTLFRHPALAPDGSSVVAEAYPIHVSVFPGPGGGVVADTVVIGAPDLMRFPLP
jgi:hypothetical protein